MIKKSNVLITLRDDTCSIGYMEIEPVCNDIHPNRIYITMRWESDDGPLNRHMSLDIEELKNAIRLIEDAEYE